MRRASLLLAVFALCACGLFEPNTGQYQAPQSDHYVHKQDYTPIVYQRRAWFESCPKGNSTERIKCAMKKERDFEESTRR